jgi:hypothetical protein
MVFQTATNQENILGKEVPTLDLITEQKSKGMAPKEARRTARIELVGGNQGFLEVLVVLQ